ncbi:unnamed protein product [Amoebophrya sp. A120]|nr:unnamed protein product [Amoebophrya sp. A120]|eukprot:GSA120T00020075001.1
MHFSDGTGSGCACNKKSPAPCFCSCSRWTTTMVLLTLHLLPDIGVSVASGLIIPMQFAQSASGRRMWKLPASLAGAATSWVYGFDHDAAANHGHNADTKSFQITSDAEATDVPADDAEGVAGLVPGEEQLSLSTEASSGGAASPTSRSSQHLSTDSHQAAAAAPAGIGITWSSEIESVATSSGLLEKMSVKHKPVHPHHTVHHNTPGHHGENHSDHPHDNNHGGPHSDHPHGNNHGGHHGDHQEHGGHHGDHHHQKHGGDHKKEEHQEIYDSKFLLETSQTWKVPCYDQSDPEKQLDNSHYCIVTMRIPKGDHVISKISPEQHVDPNPKHNKHATDPLSLVRSGFCPALGGSVLYRGAEHAYKSVLDGSWNQPGKPKGSSSSAKSMVPHHCYKNNDWYDPSSIANHVRGTAGKFFHGVSRIFANDHDEAHRHDYAGCSCRALHWDNEANKYSYEVGASSTWGNWGGSWFTGGNNHRDKDHDGVVDHEMNHDDDMI